MTEEDIKIIKKAYKESFKSRYVIRTRGRNTSIFDDKTGLVGIARCHPNDTYNARIGIIIAMMRLKGHKIPEEVYNGMWCPVGKLPIGTKVKYYSKKLVVLGNSPFSNHTFLVDEEENVSTVDKTRLVPVILRD